KEDVVIAGGAEMLQAHTQGVDAVTFQTLYQSYPVAVIVPEDSPIETLEDLAGTTLGIPGRFGETWFGALAFLEQAGLSEAEVQIEEIGFTQQAALAGGHVDAVIGFGNNTSPNSAPPASTCGPFPRARYPWSGSGPGRARPRSPSGPRICRPWHGPPSAPSRRSSRTRRWRSRPPVNISPARSPRNSRR